MVENTHGTQRQTWNTARALVFGMSIALGVSTGRVAIKLGEPRVGY